MAWAETWPKVANDPLTLEDMNDLNSELNLRAGVANAAFVEGDGLRYAIRTMRVRVHAAALREPHDPPYAPLFLNADGYAYGAPGVAGSGDGYARRINIFEELYGSPRLAWRNELDGTEATFLGDWQPPQCSLEDSEPYIFHVNELYDVINALEWQIVEMPGYSATTFYRRGAYDTWPNAASAPQDALDGAWALYLADAAEDTVISGYLEQYAIWITSSDPLSYFLIEHEQHLLYADIPADATAAKVFLYQFTDNWFKSDPDGDDDAPPAATVDIYGGTDAPAAREWDYGDLWGQIDVPDQVIAAALHGAWGVELPDIVVDDRNYFRLCFSDIATKPQYLVDDGYWPVDTWVDPGMRRKFSLSAGRRLAIKRF